MGAVIDIDRGYGAIKRWLSGVKSADIEVGILEEDGAAVAPGESGGLTMAQVAHVNEYGSEDGHIPERSFLRATVEVNRDAYVSELTRAVDAAVMGKVPLEVGFGRLGLRAEGDVKDFITDLQTPPNAPATIRRKGSSNPLIDTGHMRASIKHRIRVRRG